VIVYLGTNDRILGLVCCSFSKNILEKIKLSIDYLEIKISTLINFTVILIKKNISRMITWLANN